MTTPLIRVQTVGKEQLNPTLPGRVWGVGEPGSPQRTRIRGGGGRRYYRPDDVDLLKGIRRLLYGEGYTIRGVQRILKEHGVKSVQGLADGAAAVSFGAIEDAIGASLMEPDDEAPIKGVADADDDDYQSDEEDGIDFRFTEVDDEEILTTFRKGGTPAAPAGPSALDRERLGRALADLVACREMLDQALKDG